MRNPAGASACTGADHKDEAMSFKLKAKLLVVTLLPAMLSPRLTVLCSAAEGNWSVEEFGQGGFKNQAGPAGSDSVYLEINGVVEPAGPGRAWFKNRLEEYTTREKGQPGWVTRVDDPRLDEPPLPLTLKPQSRSERRDLGLVEGPQSEFTGFDGEEDLGQHNESSFITQEWLEMRPLVHCSGDAATFIAKGRGYSHLLVAREDAAPVSVLQLPPNCGYSVKTSHRELVLTASFEACYVLKENGSHVLPLLWWGRPVKISCPMSTAQDTLLGFCSKHGMSIMMDGVREALEDYKVKVHGEWLPLVSDACACHVGSIPEDLLFIPLTAPCVREGGGTLNVLLGGEEFTLSCLPTVPAPSLSAQPEVFKTFHLGQMETPLTPVNPSPLSNMQPTTQETSNPHVAIQPSLKPYTARVLTGSGPTKHPELDVTDSNIAGEVSTIQQPYTYTGAMNRSLLASSVDAYSVPLGTQTAATSTELISLFPHSLEPHPVISMKSNLNNHILYPIHLDTKSGHHTNIYEAPVVPSPDPTTISTHAPISASPVVPKNQEPQVPQLSASFPALPTASFKMLPSTTCMGDRLVATFPSAKKETIKIKDVKRSIWVPLASAAAHCDYLVQQEDWGVRFSSPLPACHSRALSSSIVSLTLKFWDVTRFRHRVLQLRCSTTESEEPTLTPESTAPWALATTGIAPKPKPSFSQSASTPPFHLRKPEVPPLLHPHHVLLSSHLHPTATSWLPKTPLPTQPLLPQIRCHSQHMSAILPPGPITGLTVQMPHSGLEENIKAVPLDEAPRQCGYMVKTDKNDLMNVILPYSSCHMAYKDGFYRIVLKYWSADGRGVEALLSCRVPAGHECNLPIELQLACGSNSVSAAECHGLGCCYSSSTATCYYPMDECTADRHFVFSIPASLTNPPLSPSLLVAAGNASCMPQKVVADSALFKIPLDSCGAHKYNVGKTVIYMLEILNRLQSLSISYGTITRDSPFRLLIECRYLPGTLANVSYLVKSPSLGPSIQAQGVFGVQLRIAKDQQYKSYYPQYHRPLKKLLGKPLYLEVRMLNPPDSSVKLLVHYCVAYPRSAQSAWVLIYDGCLNPLDVTSTNKPPQPPPEAVSSYVRRFTVSTFQFLVSGKDHLGFGEDRIDEEIYFMCATEVCLPSEGPCVEGCFDNIMDPESMES